MKTPTGEDGHAPSNAVVGTTVKEIVDYNRQRLWLHITNLSQTVCYIGLSQGVSTANGFHLNQNDVFVIDLDNPYSGPIYAVTDSATADLRIMQVSKAVRDYGSNQR